MFDLNAASGVALRRGIAHTPFGGAVFCTETTPRTFIAFARFSSNCFTLADASESALCAESPAVHAKTTITSRIPNIFVQNTAVCHSNSMDRDFRQGHLEIDFPTQPFDSPLALLRDSVRVFLSNLPFLAAVTLVIYLPGKLATQLLCYLLDVPFEGVLSYFVLEISDLLLSALVVPAIVYGLVHRFRTGRTASLGDSLRWGWRQWLKTLANQVKVEITVALWGALLVIPGVVAMVRLVFVDVIVAVEADLENEVLQRSTKLAQGRRWRIFFVLLPLMILDFAAMFLVLDRVQGATHSRIAFAIADSVLAVAGQLTTVATLLMYLGTVQKRVTKLKP